MLLRLNCPMGKFDIIPYGYATPGKRLPFYDSQCAEQFLNKLSHSPSAMAQLTELHARLYNIEPARPASRDTIIRQLAEKLSKRELFICPVEGEEDSPSTRRTYTGGSVIPQAEPKPRPAAKRPQWEEEPPRKEAPKYKIVIEVAGQRIKDLDGYFEITRTSDGDDRRDGTFNRSKGRDPHRLLISVDDVPDKPRELRYVVGTDRLPLAKSISPVTKDTEKSEWDNIMIPVQPLYCSSLAHKAKATLLPTGWLYVFVNGYLWRELEVHNDFGEFSDVEFGYDAGKDKRKGTGRVSQLLLLPYKINGQVQTLHLAYSPSQWRWEEVGNAGGTDPDDIRLLPHVKQKTANIPLNEAVSQKLQRIDLSSYPQGFSGANTQVEPIAQAPNIVGHEGKKPDMLTRYRNHNIPVVYLQAGVVHISIKLVDVDNTVYGNVPYLMHVGEDIIEGQATADGIVQANVPENITTVKLVVQPYDDDPDDTVSYHIRVGKLDPIDQATGQQGRLRNLGYDTGAIDGDIGTVTQNALTQFQYRQQLELSAAFDDTTRHKLQFHS